jgi:3-oxoacyl-(acyl-carrier-protein) reductase
MKPLTGKVSLVTGGSRGIGHATALALADAGSDVIFTYQHSKDAAEELCGQIKVKGVRARAFQADAASAEQIQAMAAEVTKEFGAVNVLINNAGITRDRSFVKMTKDMWDEVLRVNLDGVFFTTKAFVSGMIDAGWGRIINVSSIVAQAGNFGQANYAVTKGGLISFTKTLARELARKAITVNAVAPGFTETDMLKNMPPAALDQVKALTPLGRLGKPEEIADAIVFLARPQSAYITGQVLAVNGGMYM